MALPLFVFSPAEEVRQRSKDGPPPRTVCQVFLETTQRCAAQPALTACEEDGVDPEKNPPKTFTWAEYRAEAFSFAKALLAFGLQPRERVAIVGHNEPRWLFAYMGTLLAGGIPTGM